MGADFGTVSTRSSLTRISPERGGDCVDHPVAAREMQLLRGSGKVRIGFRWFSRAPRRPAPASLFDRPSGAGWHFETGSQPRCSSRVWARSVWLNSDRTVSIEAPGTTKPRPRRAVGAESTLGVGTSRQLPTADYSSHSPSLRSTPWLRAGAVHYRTESPWLKLLVANEWCRPRQTRSGRRDCDGTDLHCPPAPASWLQSLLSVGPAMCVVVVSSVLSCRSSRRHAPGHSAVLSCRSSLRPSGNSHCRQPFVRHGSPIARYVRHRDTVRCHVD